MTPKTLAIATKFVKVLWSERTKENLIRSINPLNEVEVQVGEKGKQGQAKPATSSSTSTACVAMARSPTCWWRSPT